MFIKKRFWRLSASLCSSRAEEAVLQKMPSRKCGTIKMFNFEVTCAEEFIAIRRKRVRRYALLIESETKSKQIWETWESNDTTRSKTKLR